MIYKLPKVYHSNLDGVSVNFHFIISSKTMVWFKKKKESILSI